MSFQPVILGPGLAGWRFVQSTLAKQTAAFEASADTRRPIEYFREKIGSIATAGDLVADRRLLEVSLTAFGLGGDIENKFFIRKILEDGTLREGALANRLSDKRYAALSKAFGFGDFSVPRTRLSYFPDEIAGKFVAQSFEEAVGAQREDIRLALNLQRALPEIVQGSASIDTTWFRVMGSPPLRQVFETALSLPDGFGQLDIDQQLSIFKDKAEGRWGTADLGQLASESLEKVTDVFLLQYQMREALSSGPQTAALSLMQGVVDFQRGLRGNQ